MFLSEGGSKSPPEITVCKDYVKKMLWSMRVEDSLILFTCSTSSILKCQFWKMFLWFEQLNSSLPSFMISVTPFSGCQGLYAGMIKQLLQLLLRTLSVFHCGHEKYFNDFLVKIYLLYIVCSAILRGVFYLSLRPFGFLFLFRSWSNVCPDSW